jgi:RNA polymerase sigma factor (sigma-70 family)
LLTSLCSSHEDDVLFQEFVRRFLPELEADCIRVSRQRKLDTHIGREIAHDVFEKLRKYKSFKTDQVRANSSHQGILVYLFGIARNLFNDWHNTNKRNKSDYVNKTYFDELTESLPADSHGADLEWKRDLAVKIFKTLNKKEQAVVLADIDHKKYGKYLPDEVTENLALTLGVKNDTIRKIRERAISKIKKAIDEINQP